MTWAEGLLIINGSVTGILVPVILYVVSRRAIVNTSNFAKLEARLDHVDECIDALRDRVIGSMVTRTELELVRDRAALDLRDINMQQHQARHDNNDRVAAVLAEVENRLTRRIERLEGRALGHSISGEYSGK